MRVSTRARVLHAAARPRIVARCSSLTRSSSGGGAAAVCGGRDKERGALQLRVCEGQQGNACNDCSRLGPKPQQSFGKELRLGLSHRPQ